MLTCGVAGADPEVMREDGMTALMFAAQCGQEGIVKRLVKTGGANPNARSDRMDGYPRGLGLRVRLLREARR